MTRATTQGDRNEDRSHRPTPPRGVGLTEPPIYDLAIPHEVSFENTSEIDDPDVRRVARVARSGGDTDQRLHYVEEGVHNLRGDFREHRAETKSELRTVKDGVDKLLAIEQTKRVAAIEIDAAKAVAAAEVEAARAKGVIAKSVSSHKTKLQLAAWLVTGGLGWWLISQLIGAH